MAINSPKLIAQASKDTFSRTRSSSNRVSHIVPGQVSDFEKDMETKISDKELEVCKKLMNKEVNKFMALRE